MANVDISSLEKDPRLFLYTSLTAGSSHIITATSRMETILKANRIPFQAIDTATDEKARRLWQRRAGKRKLPGLVKEGWVIGDITEVEEWNEFGELKDVIGPVPQNNAAPPGGQVGVNIAPPLGVKAAGAAATVPPGSAAIPKALPEKEVKAGFDKTKAVALPGAAEIAARNKEIAEGAGKVGKVETVSESSAVKEESMEGTKATEEVKGKEDTKDTEETEDTKDTEETEDTKRPEEAEDTKEPEEAEEPKKPVETKEVEESEESGKTEDVKETEDAKNAEMSEVPVETEQPKESNESKELKEPPRTNPAIDHLSAPASRIQSGSVTPAQQDEPKPDSPATEKHQSSDFVKASSVETSEIKTDNSPEDVSKPEDEAATGVAGLKVADEQAKPQEQAAAEPNAAGKSNED